MPDVLRIKRRPVGGAAGPPTSLAAAEIAFNEQDNTLYYGKGNSGGNATSIISIGGNGAYLPLAGGTLTGGITAPIYSAGAVDATGQTTIAGQNIEIGANRTANGDPFIDFHSVPGTDFEFRIQRLSGANGAAQFSQTGTGKLQLNATGGIEAIGPFSNSNFSYLGLINTSAVPSSPAPGLAVSWNQSGGQGEVDLWNTYTGGGGPCFVFKHQTGASSFVDLMSIDANGGISATAMTLTGALTTGLGTQSGAANDYEKAQFTMSGGGTISWGVVAGRLKWTGRFLVIPVVQSTMSGGYIQIDQPTTNIPAGQVYSGVARAADANGVALGAWDALYAVHTPGGGASAYLYYIVNFGATFSAPSNWILIAAVNGDDSSIKLGTGAVLRGGGTIINGVDQGYAPAVVVSDTAPSSPVVGQLWYDSVNARMFMWYSDPNSSQWVQL